MLTLRTEMNYDKALLGRHSFSAVQEEEGNILLRNVVFTSQHGVTSFKTLIFINIAARNSNLTSILDIP
jgi:hypothetical protein